MTEKYAISLTKQQAAFARSLVDKGHYSSLSSVVQQGLDLFRKDVEAKETYREALRQLIKQRRGRPSIAGGEMNSRISSMVESKRRENCLAG